MPHIILYQPQIPPNTGNIIRLAANTGFHLHLIEPLGFTWDNKQLRRAGLDYREYARINRYRSYQEFTKVFSGTRIFALTTKAQLCYSKVRFEIADGLLFGSETSGLPALIHADFPDSQKLRLPMMQGNRSLNLANSVAIVSYEVWRQLDFIGGQ